MESTSLIPDTTPRIEPGLPKLAEQQSITLNFINESLAYNLKAKNMEKEITPLYIKPLKRDGWQIKFYIWAYGKEPRFKGYCPLFHAIWLGALLSPFIFFWKTCKKTWALLCDFWPESPEPPFFPDDDDFESLLNYGARAYEYSVHPYYIKLDQWVVNNPNYKEIWEEIKKEKKKKEDAKIVISLINAERRARLQEKMDKINHYASYFVKPILVTSAIFVGWGVWKLAIVLWNIFDFWAVMWVLGHLAIVVVSLIVFLGIIMSLIKVSNKIAEGEIKIGFLQKLGTATKEAFDFVIASVKMIYTKNCPIIEYSDSTDKIQKKNEN